MQDIFFKVLMLQKSFIFGILDMYNIMYMQESLGAAGYVHPTVVLKV